MNLGANFGRHCLIRHCLEGADSISGDGQSERTGPAGPFIRGPVWRRSIFIVHPARYDTLERQFGLSFYFGIPVRNPLHRNPAVHRNNAAEK